MNRDDMNIENLANLFDACTNKRLKDNTVAEGIEDRAQGRAVGDESFLFIRFGGGCYVNEAAEPRTYPGALHEETLRMENSVRHIKKPFIED
jgi:hypothetical protein